MIGRLLRKLSELPIGGIGAGALFMVVYIAASSSLYFGLGLIAEQGMALTPLLMVVGAIFFALTLMSYLEGSSLHVERGGASSFARYAFDEFWSFVAGWAILLDYAIVLALVASTVPNYLSVFWDGFADHTVEMLLPPLLIAAVAVINVRGVTATRLRRGMPFGWLDMLVMLSLIVLGLILIWHPSRLVDSISIGDTPTWEGIIVAAIIATVAGTGIEAGSGLAGEIRIGKRGLKGVAVAGSAATLLIYTGITLVALMAVPVLFDTAGGSSTALGTTYLERPLTGITEALHPQWLADAMTYVIAAMAAITLFQAARIYMLGPLRLSYALATHRQVPSRLARLHPRYGTPYVAAIAVALVASSLALLDDPELLVAIFAFGSLVTFSIANLAIIVLRYREPAANRAFRVPLSVNIRGGTVPLPSVLAFTASVGALVGVLVFRHTATLVGSLWLLSGILLYVVYRRSQGQPLRQRITVPEEDLKRPAKQATRAGYGSILVPVFGGVLDDDIVGTAGRLAMEEADELEGGAVIEALHVIEIPMSQPIDAPVPEERVDRARRVLARAKEVGEEYAGVEVATATVRARSTGEAIVREAARRGVEAIVLAAERPSRIRGGPLLGGVEPRAAEFVGKVTEYVARKAPCRVILTAPPETDVESLMESIRQNPHVSEHFASKQGQALDRLRDAQYRGEDISPNPATDDDLPVDR